MMATTRVYPGDVDGVDIAALAPDRATDAMLVTELVALVNRVYTEAEAGLWVDGMTRTNHRYMADSIGAGEIAAARWNGLLVGAICVELLADGDGKFGMLVAAPEHRGLGIGRELVAFAERWVQQCGATEMQLELLVPRDWSHPAKEFLRSWYADLGYRVVRTTALAEDYPELAPQLATPCDLVIYAKPLQAATAQS
jgi:GNAT superfamily N-acetyltransferase